MVLLDVLLVPSTRIELVKPAWKAGTLPLRHDGELLTRFLCDGFAWLQTGLFENDLATLPHTSGQNRGHQK